MSSNNDPDEGNYEQEEIVHRHEISIVGSDEIEIEHSIGLLTLLILCFVIWAPCWWYDAEIRCALGNEKMCATIKVFKP